MTRTVVVAIAVLVTVTAMGQELKTEVVDGGPAVTDLGYNVQVNKGSTLHRSFAIINDPSAPIQLAGTGVNTRYGRDRYSFVPVGTVSPSEALTAFEVRFVLYDVFGNRLKTLSAMHVTDMPGGSSIGIADIGSWYAFEAEVSELLTVAAFVANVRTASGKVWRANEKKVTEELEKLNLKVTSGTLEPTKDEKSK
jgi:hypothetical protein